MTTPTLDRPTNPAAASVRATKATDTDRSVRKASITAGVGLVLMSALSAFGYLIAVKGLVTQGDAARTAQNIAAHEGMFRFGIVSLYLVAALDVIVAWALYRLFRPVSKGISNLAAWLRIAYAGVFVIAISQLVGVLRLVGTDQLQSHALGRIHTFTDVWDAGLVLFGLHLFVIAYLAIRSSHVPRLLGLLLAIAGFGYLFDSLGAALSHGSPPDVAALTGLGEFVFALWLVSRGRSITLSQSGRERHHGSRNA